MWKFKLLQFFIYSTIQYRGITFQLVRYEPITLKIIEMDKTNFNNNNTVL